jgi:hypothetical protein
MIEIKVYPSDVEEEDIEDAEDGRGQPDGDEGDEGESDAPDESQRQGKDGSQQTVDPVACAGEQNVRSAPDWIESVGGIRFSQNIFKVQLQRRQMKYNSSSLGFIHQRDAKTRLLIEIFLAANNFFP